MEYILISNLTIMGDYFRSLFFILMKKYTILLFIFIISVNVSAAHYPELSPFASVTQRIGLTDISVTYHRPSTRGRVIWGGVVPYDEIWRAGANEATVISFTDDVQINKHTLKAGSYSFYVVPSKKRWKIIFNANPKQWGHFTRNKNQDVLSFYVKPVVVTDTEWLIYYFSDIEFNTVSLNLKWAKLQVSFTIKVDTEKKLSRLDALVVEEAWRQLELSARSYFNYHGDLNTALRLINKSISINKNYVNFQTKALILASKKNYKEAVAIGEEAIKLGNKEKAETGRDPFMWGSPKSAKMMLYDFKKQIKKWKKFCN